MPFDTPEPLSRADEMGARWRACLRLRFVAEHGRTRLHARRHSGPLVVQRTLYPEGQAVAQAAVVHPPGGIAGGDDLRLDVELEAHSRVQLVTPAATKWYRARGDQGASQTFRARIAPGAVLEWLPHEAIVFDGARAQMTNRLELHGSAVAMMWEVVALGRAASGERFVTGSVRQRFEVVRDGELLWIEQGVLDAGSGLRESTIGLAGRHAFGTFVIAAADIDDATLAAARGAGSEVAQVHRGGHGIAAAGCAVTRVPGVLLARAIASDACAIHRWFATLWSTLRPHVTGRAAVMPRLWAT